MKWSELHRVQSMDENKLNVVVTSLYGPDFKPVTVNVQRLRPYHESELNFQVHPVAPECDREKVPSQEPYPEDNGLDEVDAHNQLLLAASTITRLGKNCNWRETVKG